MWLKLRKIWLLLVAVESCMVYCSKLDVEEVTTLESTPENVEYVDTTYEGVPVEYVTESQVEPEFVPRPLARDLNCTQCKCGIAPNITGSQGKIVGGITAPENLYPWMAALYYNNRFTCGGSLVSDRYVLTAAHCAIRMDPARFRVQLLVHNRTQPSQNSIERSVKAIKSFFFNGLSNNNDIALLELTFPVTISADRLVPVCLPPANDGIYEGKMAVVTGWGKLASGGLSATLQELKVPILANRECRRAGYWAIQITNRMMCAGFVQGGQDSCQGDSGGPLQILNNATKRYELAGIVSWGRACAQKNYPGVYTRVSKFLRWITANIKDSCVCS